MRVYHPKSIVSGGLLLGLLALLLLFTHAASGAPEQARTGIPNARGIFTGCYTIGTRRGALDQRLHGMPPGRAPRDLEPSRSDRASRASRSVGAQGPSGERGETGAQGAQGSPGPSGTGGSPGPGGPQGPVGPAGGPGPPGSMGAPGAAGPQGPPGADGADSGPAGPLGPPGPAGAGRASRPPWSLRDPPVLPGPAGPIGPPGADGLSWTSRSARRDRASRLRRPCRRRGASWVVRSSGSRPDPAGTVRLPGSCGRLRHVGGGARRGADVLAHQHVPGRKEDPGRRLHLHRLDGEPDEPRGGGLVSQCGNAWTARVRVYQNLGGGVTISLSVYAVCTV